MVQGVAVWCRVLQCGAGCWSVVQGVGVWCSIEKLGSLRKRPPLRRSLGVVSSRYYFDHQLECILLESIL